MKIAIIKFRVHRGYCPNETNRKRQDIPMKHAISKNRTFVWLRLFKEDRELLEDDKRGGRIRTLDATSFEVIPAAH